MTSDKMLFQSVIKMIDSLSTAGNYDTIVHILSLLCLLSISNNTANQTIISSTPPMNQSNDNPIQKLLGDLTKGGNGLGSPDMLMSLLPLLNNPQIKSKINPTSIASVMGIINNLGNVTSPTKEDTIKTKSEKESPTEAPAPPSPIEPKKEEVEIESNTTSPEVVSEDSEKKSATRFLNWKTNF
ncbi:hypothetical protein [Anaerosinus massiliensis]|uniref:hypothetical protein n=1 Tax=Massilibacillus massiliensis TaxID=1806837 RepID=UPI000A52CEED|nr:hypothetical protein [Massilibacillus massiliensis]